MKMSNFLQQHYPFFKEFKKAIYVPNVVSALTFLFVLVFDGILNQPEQKISSVAFIALFMIYGSQLISRIILPRIFQKTFTYEKWTVGKEIMLFVFELSLAFLLGYFLLKVIWQIPAGELLYKTFKNVATVLLGIQLFILPLSIFIKKEMVLQKHLDYAKHLNMVLFKYRNGPLKIKKELTLLLDSNDKLESLQLNANYLDFIKVTDNYVEIYYSENGASKKTLLRNTLKSINDAVKDVDFIFQCHRSYVINLRKVVSINGNSRGYKINIENYSDDIPVSRNKILEFDSLISNLLENRQA